MESESDQPAPVARAGMPVAARVVEVTSADIGQRIDNYLLKTLKGVPRSRIYKMLRKGEVRINGGRVRPTRRLATGDRVRIPPHHAPQPAPSAFLGSRDLARIEAAILHEDDDLVVLDKPSGLAVHGGSGVSVGAIEALRKLRPKQDLELVHRLDRDTSGCLLIAKRRAILRKLHEQLRLGKIRKRYLLIVHGHWPDERREVTLPLYKYVSGNGERRVRVDQQGKDSRTGFEVQGHARQASLLRATLHTGRTHQIRVHALAAGHPVLGDDKYAGDKAVDLARHLEIRRLCLHSSEIAFHIGSHPLMFQAPLPAELQTAWQRLTAQ